MIGPVSLLRTQFNLLLVMLVAAFLFSSCGWISLTRKTEFIPETEDVTVSISDEEDGAYTEITERPLKIKLNHLQKRYWIKQERLGYVSRTQEISRTATNKLKLLDLALLIPTGVAATIFTPLHFVFGPSQGIDPSLGQSIALFSAIGVGVAGWGAVIPIPRKIYPKKIELPALIPIITKDTNQLFLTAGKHEFNLSKRGVRVRDYESMKQFEKGYGYKTRDTAESFEFIEKLKLYEEVVDILDKAEYGIDSSKAQLNNSLKVDSWTRSVVYNITEDQIQSEVKVGWALETLDELQYLYGKGFRGQSEWVDFNESDLDQKEQEKVIEQTMLDAMDESFKRFIALDTVQSILSSPVPIPLEEEEELTLQTGATFSTSVGSSVKSVITIVTNEGHGSGCIVTPDGYVITNAHVVADDTTDLMAIMSADVEKKIPLKFIRMNEAVDLALLKIDTAGLTPLKLCEKNDIETGADAFAIGTPADIELGQTVTRGIISGKRKFGGHQVIQTDVAISPGNSGGALIRKDGLLLGIVTAEMKSRRIDDIGFAIPSHLIESALKIKLKN